MSALQVGTAVDQERTKPSHAGSVAVEVRAGACGRVLNAEDWSGVDSPWYQVCFTLSPLVVTLWVTRDEIRPI